MQLPILIAIAFSLLASPFWTKELYQRAYAWEKAQIAVDNAAIRLGRDDRALFNFVHSSNRLIAVLELAHDPVHVCAHSLIGSPFCAEEDATLEAEILEWHQMVSAIAQAKWRLNRTAALSEMFKLGVQPGEILRATWVPLVEKRCSVCGLPTYWERSSSGVNTILSAATPFDSRVRVQFTGASLVRGGRWNYRLDPIGRVR